MTSLKDVLEMSKRDLVATFAGKYVFVGENGTLIHDELISPVTGTKMAGVETHAHMLDGILQNRIPVAVSPEYLVSILLGVGLLMVTLYFLIPHIFSPFLAVVAFLFTIWLGRYMYGAQGIVFDVFPALLAMSLLSFPITFIYRFFIVDRERRKLQKNFSHYIDPVVVQKIADM